ncbi:MAG TPA: hypothetical protein DCQ06_05950 [Myxococcales bacterium]|nr:hypothetical protein [Myxococcales bacterium]HAN31124.1 hypothetical protein [Myxococcales bacterium]
MFNIVTFTILLSVCSLMACSTSTDTKQRQILSIHDAHGGDAEHPLEELDSDGTTANDTSRLVNTDTSLSVDTDQGVDTGAAPLADVAELDTTKDDGQTLDSAASVDSGNDGQDTVDASSDTGVSDTNAQSDVADTNSALDTVDASSPTDTSDATSQSDSGALDTSPNCQLKLEVRARDQSGPCAVCKAGNYITLDAVVHNPCSTSKTYASAYSCIASEFSVLNLTFNSKAVYASSCSKNNPLNKTIAPGAIIKQSRPAGKLSAHSYKLAVQFKNAANTVRTTLFEVK